ncbi:hypothetical protein [Aurantimonas endophytica]|uniref:Uncharacterized protein n=1 Tax=Aurantimonas endophytica TaxID=1522175 RepID=A0A7W6MNY5_9HYPH|nr:hypothetical protein [Aurantimonas endophytica]MBB4002375.1 hypothetical protein [Aurantimonas endophytica]
MTVSRLSTQATDRCATGSNSEEATTPSGGIVPGQTDDGGQSN